MIKFNNVSKRYENDQNFVLNDVTFTIEEGSYTSIVGQNGSGKSTIIKVLLGLEKFQIGEVALFNQNINNFKDWHKVGYVPQNTQRYNRGIPTTVEEVVSTGLICLPTKLTKSRKDEMISDTLAKLSLQGFEKKVVLDLSGGQQQRVFVARSLVHDPKLLIFDEPTIGIDAANVAQFYDLIQRLHKEGKTIVIVSHDTHALNKNVTHVVSVNETIEFAGKKADYLHWYQKHCESS